MNIVAIIPARYSSTRFPGKPLALLRGKEIILHVCEKVAMASITPIVATDNYKIYERVEKAGYKAVMTSPDHRSGTDRIKEALDKINSEEIDVVINVQGDEPFIRPQQLMALSELFKDKHVNIATLIKKFNPKDGIDALFNPNLVKVVIDKDGKALYFSRFPIPYQRGVEKADWLYNHDFHSHIGVYAYRPETLRKITELPQSQLEKSESLEQLRWLENGYTIYTMMTEGIGVGIDTPEDLVEAERLSDLL
ncbi:MAG: 3-deoxy-manno-octulosonate cytidylyltransferase [Muribaculaceae bacterium]|nr:3-deoxy-manno-octulosonate cytidylyltransferase [Muribaculaceae bacterium]